MMQTQPGFVGNMSVHWHDLPALARGECQGFWQCCGCFPVKGLGCGTRCPLSCLSTGVNDVLLQSSPDGGCLSAQSCCVEVVQCPAKQGLDEVFGMGVSASGELLCQITPVCCLNSFASCQYYDGCCRDIARHFPMPGRSKASAQLQHSLCVRDGLAVYPRNHLLPRVTAWRLQGDPMSDEWIARQRDLLPPCLCASLTCLEALALRGPTCCIVFCPVPQGSQVCCLMVLAPHCRYQLQALLIDLCRAVRVIVNSFGCQISTLEDKSVPSQCSSQPVREQALVQRESHGRGSCVEAVGLPESYRSQVRDSQYEGDRVQPCVTEEVTVLCTCVHAMCHMTFQRLLWPLRAVVRIPEVSTTAVREVCPNADICLPVIVSFVCFHLEGHANSQPRLSAFTAHPCGCTRQLVVVRVPWIMCRCSSHGPRAGACPGPPAHPHDPASFCRRGLSALLALPSDRKWSKSQLGPGSFRLARGGGCTDRSRRQPYAAVRVGEATNPGPQADIRGYFKLAGSSPLMMPEPASSSPLMSQADPTTFGVAVANPTAVQGKADVFVKLGAQVLLLSETSAVLPVQTQVAQQLRRRGFASVWGAPVEPHLSPKDGQPTRRGHAAGVAIASSLPLTSPPVQLSPEALATQRMVEAMLRVGSMQIRIICLYGYPSTYVEAKARNDQLLRMALERISQSQVPTLVGGDLNMSVLQLPVWSHFEYLGYQEFFQFYAGRFGEELPPTCRQSTKNDTILIPPILQGMVHHACVDSESHSFDSHDALIVRFRMSPTAMPKLWKMPKPWAQFHPNMDCAEAMYRANAGHVKDVIHSCQTTDDVSHAFQVWASAVEESVDASLRHSHASDPVSFPFPGLPRAARGRCAYRTRVECDAKRVAPNARQGDYAPVREATTMHARRQVKQVRRIQTLLRGLQSFQRKLKADAVAAMHGVRHLQKEWAVIRRNKAFGPRFDIWLLGVLPFGQVWEDLPPIPWLQDVYDFSRHVCDASVRMESKQRYDRFRYLVQLDISSNGQKQGFAQLRPRPRPPITCLPVTEVRNATRAGPVDGSSAYYEVANPQYLRTQCQVYTSSGKAVVEDVLVETEGERADLVKLNFLEQGPPPQCKLSQTTQAVTGPELEREFSEFWVRLWWRDSRLASRSIEEWGAFLQEVPDAPEHVAPIAIPLTDVNLWEQAQARIRPHRATGYDGFSPSELKDIRGSQLQDLVALFDVAVRKGYPAHLARARVHTLAKVDVPESFSDGRPITIFGATYRLWASIVARAVLQSWSAWLPDAVAGSVPGRSSRDIAYRIQCAVEEALAGRSPLGGFSIDITKAFNQLPQPPVMLLLKRLGVPPDIVDFWHNFLQVSERSPVLGGGIGTPIGSTTGAPEGDPMAVVAMASVCWMISQNNASTGSDI